MLLKGAHAVEREAKVLQELWSMGFPVPRVHGVCMNEEILGTRFYVMDHIEGRVIWDATFPEVDITQRPLYFDAMNEAIAQLHCINYTQAGLEDYGRPGEYLERQIARWTSQYADDASLVGRDPFIEKLIEWLPVHIPSSTECSIVHGDFRVDNMIFHPSEPRVIAVLDWELSTLGNPLADFAYHLMMFRMPPQIIAGLAGSDLAKLNIPTETEYIAAYCARTGRENIPDLDFYLSFNMFRLAAILHGIHGRLIRGSAVSPHAREMAASYPFVAKLAWQQSQGDQS
ncbi:aminoglycoside phosphotransferase [Cupriavidus sp. UYMMa02A]|nr:aminoglycoside phosphotransferase [Cupriavidus sp. UYMMa02A]